MFIAYLASQARMYDQARLAIKNLSELIFHLIKNNFHNINNNIVVRIFDLRN